MYSIMPGSLWLLATEDTGAVAYVLSLFKALRIARLAVSMGGPETLVCHPATMTHGLWAMTTEDRLAAGISDGYVRIRSDISSHDVALTVFAFDMWKSM